MKAPSQIVEKIEECLSQKKDEELKREVDNLDAEDLADIFNGSLMLGVVVFLAMIINLIIAGVFGALVPLTLKYLRGRGN